MAQGTSIDPVAQGMKKTEISIPLIEGFPLESETIKWMQESYTLLSVLGEIVGDKAIIKGCNLTGNTVSAGYIYILGELLFFQGGQTQTTIVIVEEVIQREWEDGTMRDTYKRRHAEFGSGVTQYNWSEFNRVDPLIIMMQKISNLEKKTAVFQADGGMLFWNKPANEIPEGWHEVEDWRGRLPVGMDASQYEYDTLGKEGGEKKVTISRTNLPNFNLPISQQPHNHQAVDTTAHNGNENGTARRGDPHNGIDIHTSSETIAITVNSGGSGTQMAVLNPYRTVLFIEFID